MERAAGFSTLEIDLEIPCDRVAAARPQATAA
jgi:hypothetical protein